MSHFHGIDPAYRRHIFTQTIQLVDITIVVPVVGISAAYLVWFAAQDLGDGARDPVVHRVELHLPLAVRADGRVRKWVEQVGVAEGVGQLSVGADHHGHAKQKKNHLLVRKKQRLKVMYI